MNLGLDSTSVEMAEHYTFYKIFRMTAENWTNLHKTQQMSNISKLLLTLPTLNTPPTSQLMSLVHWKKLSETDATWEDVSFLLRHSLIFHLEGKVMLKERALSGPT